MDLTTNVYVFKQKGIEKKEKHQTCHRENITKYELVIQIINIVFIVITLSGIHTTGAMSCPLSRKTAVRVNRCPRNQFEWNYRETRFNCSSFNQSCVNKNMFTYHCAMNEEVNELLELCAPTKFIHGQKCVEYNFLGSIIQESIIDCSNTTVPCPDVYQSTEAFKYQSCYDAVQLSEEEPKVTLNCSTLRCGNATSDLPAKADETCFWNTAVIVTTCIITVLLHCSFYISWRSHHRIFRNHCRCFKKRKRKKIDKRLKAVNTKEALFNVPKRLEEERYL